MNGGWAGWPGIVDTGCLNPIGYRGPGGGVWVWWHKVSNKSH